MSDDLDQAYMPLAKASDSADFLVACRTLRHWPHELTVELDAHSKT